MTTRDVDEHGAAQELGGLEALAGGSFWAHNVWSMAKARNYDDEWEPGQ